MARSIVVIRTAGVNPHCLVSSSPAFPPLPLGQPIPASPHAVSCSLPTMRSVRGYEEKDPEIVRQLTNGYPRFVVHPFTKRLVAHLTAATYDAGTIKLRLVDPDFPLGRAANLTICRGGYCPAECGVP